MRRIKCRYEPEHYHEYPDDWIFGGANGLDPRADSRWQPTTYQYYDFTAMAIHTTQAPLCDDQAIDEFTKVASMGPSFHPKWIGAFRPDGTVDMLPWVYDKGTDTATYKDQV